MSESRLFKRGRIWWCWFYDRQGNRKQESTKTRDKVTAREIARELERQAQDPDGYRRAQAAFGDAVKAWLNHKEEEVKARKLSAKTQTYWHTKVGNVLVFMGKDAPLSEFRPRDVRNYISHRRQQGTGEKTIKEELLVWKQVLRNAKFDGLWSGDLEEFFPDFAATSTPGERCLTRGEVRLMLAALPRHHAARLAFAVATSARYEEASHVVAADLGTEYVTLRTGKLKSGSRLPETRQVPIMHEWQRELLAFARRHAPGQKPGQKLFARPKSEVFENAAERVDLATSSHNDWRRTFCTWMLAEGVAPHLVSKMMGHTSTQMVERVYGKLSAEQIRALVLGPDDCCTDVAGLTNPDGLTELADRVTPGNNNMLRAETERYKSGKRDLNPLTRATERTVKTARIRNRARPIAGIVAQLQQRSGGRHGS